MSKFSTRHYKALAATLAASKPERWGGGAEPAQWASDVLGIANMLTLDNPRFDRERWLKATTYTGWDRVLNKEIT